MSEVTAIEVPIIQPTSMGGSVGERGSAEDFLRFSHEPGHHITDYIVIASVNFLFYSCDVKLFFQEAAWFAGNFLLIVAMRVGECRYNAEIWEKCGDHYARSLINIAPRGGVASIRPVAWVRRAARVLSGRFLEHGSAGNDCSGFVAEPDTHLDPNTA